MVIRTAVPPFKEGEKNLQSIKPQDNSFCSCFSSGNGKTIVGTLFEKNIYTPNEVAIAHVDINNEECKTDIKSVSFYIVQKIWACTIEDDRTYNFNYKQKLCKHKIKGPKAGDNILDEQITLDLSKIKYDVTKTKRKHGGQLRDRSMEDQFLMASLQPETDSEHLRNQYYFAVELEYADGTPASKIGKQKLTILPVINPYTLGFNEPMDYTGVQLGFFKTEIENLSDLSDSQSN